MKALRPKEVAERWKCSERHIYMMIANGSLAAFRIGGRLWRVSEGAVEEFEKCHPSSGLSSLGDTFMQLGENAAKPGESPSAPKVVRLPSERYTTLPSNTRWPNGRDA
jgi:excisionase family DNA binding protein